MPFFKPKSKTPPTAPNPPIPNLQYQSTYVAPQNQLSAPFQHVTNQQYYWEQPMPSPNSNTLVPFGSTTIARPNSALENSSQWMPPSPRINSATPMSYGGSTAGRQDSIVPSPQHWLPPPPPLPPRFDAQGTANASPNSSMQPGRPEIGRSYSSNSSLPSPVISIPTPPSSGYLEAPRQSPWAQPGSARSPSPFAVPQRKQEQPEPPKIRKILSLGMTNCDHSNYLVDLYKLMHSFRWRRDSWAINYYYIKVYYEQLK